METLISIQEIKNINRFEKFDVSIYLLSDKTFSSSPKGMSKKSIAMAIKEIHKRKKKAAVKVDCLYQQSEISELQEYLFFLNKAGCDYIVFSDIAIKQISKENNLQFKTIYAPETLITNRYEVKELKNDGFDGVVISKDIPLENALLVADYVPDYSYLRAHGPILMSYSERRFISVYLKKKKEYLSEYYLSEENRNIKMPIVEKKSGTWFYYACLHCLNSIKRLYNSNFKGLIFDFSLYDDEYALSVLKIYQDIINGTASSIEDIERLNKNIKYIEVSDIKLTQLEKE